MSTIPPHSVVVPLDWRESYDHWGLFPSAPGTRGPRRRFKALTVRKGNCAFTRDVPRGMIEFVYRSVIRLGLRERRLAITRGMVRKGALNLVKAVAVRELAWGAGTAIVIPRALRFNERIRLVVDGEPASPRAMDLVVLNALLRMSRPENRPEWHTAMAAAIIVQGWKSLERTDIPAVMSGETTDGKSPRKHRPIK